MMMKFVLTIWSLIGCGISPLLAQDADDGAREASGGRLVWIVATAIPDGLENPASVMAGEDIHEVLLSKRMAGNAVKIPADGMIRMVRQIPNPEDNSKDPVYQTLAGARIPDGVNKALMILVPRDKPAEDGSIFRTRVQDLADFRGGDTLYLNLTTVRIAVQLGEDKIGLKPGQTRIHEARDLDQSTNKAISYHFFHPEREEWKLLSASTVVLRPTRREICIFSWDPRYKRVNYHGITFPVTQ